jgi:chromosome partitioning protein
MDGYDLVLIACPPSLGLLPINALTAASRLIVVTEPSSLALQGLEELLNTSELVRTHLQPRLEVVGVVVNRCERTVEHRESCAEIERYFGDGLAWRPYLPKRTVLQDAARRGVPVDRLAGRPAGELHEAFADLAERIGAADAAR